MYKTIGGGGGERERFRGPGYKKNGEGDDEH